jgi:mono/diheme cytochrome c family protein
MKTLIAIIAVAGAAARLTAAEKVDFVKDIQPVLQQNCIKCHGPEKQKGKLRLDSRDAALEGGKYGPALVAGDGTRGELVRRISLPKTDDDFMPAEGEPLPKEQIALIKKWIDEGAVWLETALPKESANEKPAAPLAPALPKDFKPSRAEQRAVAALAQKGIDLRPIATNTPWREANLRLLGTSVNDSTLASLKDVASLVSLNLAATKITDKGLESLKGLRNLRRLHLELTAVTDAGLSNLKPLAKLTYLNLYGTNVTDAGLEHLKGLTYLRNLYVWQSKVTDAGVEGLKAALPHVEVSTGSFYPNSTPTPTPTPIPTPSVPM